MTTDKKYEHGNGADNSIRLQVMKCAYGEEGIKRVAAGMHPVVAGVEYLVSWQTDAHHHIPEQLDRDDFKIIQSRTRGLSVNRNIALSHASAPLLLISDDDTDYTEECLKTVIREFDNHPEADILAFRFESKSATKRYPESIFSLDSPPKGYYISSIEIAFRKNPVKGKVWFNENFGVGSIFPSGEEDIFVKDCLDLGLKGLFIPKTIVRHDSPTTSARTMKSALRPMTKGAVFLRLHPRDWQLRMIMHALREIPSWCKGSAPSPLSYCRSWLKGVRKARQLAVFPTQDYSESYPHS